MTASEFTSTDGTRLSVVHAGLEEAPVQLIWAHGWGQSGAALLPLAESLSRVASSSVVDFPGFGNSPAPPLTWTTADFADQIAEWLRESPRACRIWVGHSFGCRVGLQLAARHPELLSGMVLISAAGLRPRRRLGARIRFTLRKYLFKTVKLLVPEGPRRDAWRSRLGSADYRAAGGLRAILSRVVAEDLSTAAQAVRCPTLLVYGDQDQDTPPEMGERLRQLVPDAKLVLLKGFDHNSVISEGRHQVLGHLKKFVENTCPS
jgi:pimeloyl-ACP methyl ester carboxylesterase